MKISHDSNLDLKRLVKTRLLINANSGGGKSWAIRRLLEQSHGKVQQIVIDLEGEFATLREKYDYLLVGQGGEIPISIRTAEILARKLLELNVSAILDLSELKHPERITFVKRFLDSLVNAPKNLWHPALIIVDEAHQFCPEKSHAESASAVIDLMTRGRKRDFCGVLATQRVSKLHKDAVAECNNYMIGRTGLDIDMKRASEVLGFTTKEDFRSLRDLEAGEFYAFGTAFEHAGVKKIRVGDVTTTHEMTKVNLKTPIKTPANIQKILKDVVDLPKEAEEELRTTADLKRKITELKTKLTLSERGSKTVVKVDERAIEKAHEIGYKKGLAEGQSEVKAKDKVILSLTTKMSQIGKILGQEVVIPKQEVRIEKPVLKPVIGSPRVLVERNIQENKTTPQPISSNGENGQLRAGAMKMLNWLAGAHPNGLTKQRIATLSGFSASGGTFNTYLSELKRNGWITDRGGDLAITEDGLMNATPIDIPSGEELLSMWKGKFRQGAGAILQVVYDAYPNTISKEDIGLATNFEPSGGTFNTYLSELRRNGLIVIEGNEVRISSEFYD